MTRLLSLVANLHDKPLYSDIILQLSDRTIPAHRFVLNARSTQWNQSDENLLSTESLDLTHVTPYVASILIRWVYTDTIILPQEQSAIIELLSATNTPNTCLLYTSPSPRDRTRSRMPSSA